MAKKTGGDLNKSQGGRATEIVGLKPKPAAPDAGDKVRASMPPAKASAASLRSDKSNEPMASEQDSDRTGLAKGVAKMDVSAPEESKQPEPVFNASNASSNA